MDTPAPHKTASFPHLAAKLSWVCPIITVAIIVSVLLLHSRQIGARVAFAVAIEVALLLVAVGSIFGIVALFGISKHGTKGILLPAIVGLIISGLLVLFFIIVA